MGIDTIKVYFTYGVVAFVVVAGFAYLYVIRNDPAAGKDTVALVAGFIGSCLTFLTNQVVQSQTAHQTNVAASTLTTSTNGTTPETKIP